MSTKEEVLRLAEAAGFYPSNSSNYLDKMTKLIELAKQAGAAEELEECEYAFWSLKSDRYSEPSIEYAAWRNGILDCFEAIRNRAAKPNQE